MTSCTWGKGASPRQPQQSDGKLMLLSKNSEIFYSKTYPQSSINPSQSQENWVWKFYFLVLFFFLSFILMHNLNFIGLYQCSAHQKAALLSVSFLSWVGATCKLRLASYGCKDTSQCPPNTPLCCTCTHNLKTTWHIWMFYLLNNCLATRDHVALVWTCMLCMVGELQLQTCISVLCTILCVLTCIALKVPDIFGCFTYWMTALLLETSFCGLEFHERAVLWYKFAYCEYEQKYGVPTTLLHSNWLHSYPGWFFLC